MMKAVRSLLGVLCCVAAAPAGAEEIVGCTYAGIELKGKVEIVDTFGDIKIEIVDRFADINVQRVERFADECGEWQLVDSFPDFTVEIVESLGDITVKWVDAFPGTD